MILYIQDMTSLVLNVFPVLVGIEIICLWSASTGTPRIEIKQTYVELAVKISI
jgi:hypothetical protein